MKIALVTGSSPPLKCGVGDYTYRLGRELSKHAEIFILTTEGAEVYNEKNFKVVPVVKSWHLDYFSSLFAVLKNIKPDVVHIQYPTQGYTGWLAFFVPLLCWFLRIPVVQTWHEFLVRKDVKFFSLYAWVPGGLVYVRPNFLSQSHWLARVFAFFKKKLFIPNGSAVPSSTLKTEDILRKRSEWLRGQKRLIVFFGFIYPDKGVEKIFEIADPTTDQIIIIGEINPQDPYHQMIQELADSPLWTGKATLTGFLKDSEVSDYLRSADAAVFPMKNGAGIWNTSLHAARKNNCPVLTTTLEKTYLKDQLYFTNVNETQNLKKNLNELIAKYPFDQRIQQVWSPVDEWQEIAQQHLSMFKSVRG